MYPSGWFKGGRLEWVVGEGGGGRLRMFKFAAVGERVVRLLNWAERDETIGDWEREVPVGRDFGDGV